MGFRLKSLYLCVTDMDRAVLFYETLLEQPVTEKDELYSVFDINGFRLGLFAFEKAGESHTYGSNCLPSLSVDSLKMLEKKIEGKEICFPLTKIRKNWVVEIVDSEGNHIEMTAPVVPEHCCDPQKLIANLERLHTTEKGCERIRKNLGLEEKDVVSWCCKQICSDKTCFERQGKNWYIKTDDCEISVNATSYTIITAHRRS